MLRVLYFTSKDLFVSVGWTKYRGGGAGALEGGCSAAGRVGLSCICRQRECSNPCAETVELENEKLE